MNLRYWVFNNPIKNWIVIFGLSFAIFEITMITSESYFLILLVLLLPQSIFGIIEACAFTKVHLEKHKNQ